MTSQLPPGASRAEYDRARSDLTALEAEYATLAADGTLAAAGFLPPPWGTAADVTSLGRSLFRGDWGGAVLDAIGLVPIAGDAVKAGKIAERLRALESAIAAASQRVLRHARNLMDARRTTANAYWNDIVTRGRRRFDEATSACTTQACREAKVGEIGEHYKRTPVSGGRWTNGMRGDGLFVPDAGSPLGRALQDFNGNPALRRPGSPLPGIPYRDGFPVFDDFVVPAGSGRAQVDILQSGVDDLDFAAADDALREATGFTRRDLRQQHGNLTWHHHQDGVTMQLVPTELHGSRYGVGHSGGASLNDREAF